MRSSQRWGVLTVLFAIVLAVFASGSTSMVARLVKFDWSWKSLKAANELPPPEAPFWETQQAYEKTLRRRGLFVIHTRETALVVKAAAVGEYLESALESFKKDKKKFAPPTFNSCALALPEFSALVDAYVEWSSSQSSKVSVADVIEMVSPTTEAIDSESLDSPGPSPMPLLPEGAETTKPFDPRKLAVTTTSGGAPSPDTTTRLTTPVVTTTGAIPTTVEEIVYPAHYDSCDWSTRPTPPACDNGWNACQDPQCDGRSVDVLRRPQCACSDADFLAGNCIFFQCDSDSDGFKDTCVSDSTGDGTIDESDTDCGSKDEFGTAIPNSMLVCPQYQNTCTPYDCYCTQECKQFNDCCADFDDFCEVCSCGPYSDTCCCNIGQYNADCNGLVGSCNCQNCTCVAGEYFYSSSLTDTCLSRACEPASCSAGQYLADCECGTGTLTTKPGTCTPCITSCAVGEYMDGVCDGTTIEDIKVCTLCTASGACPNKTYFDSTECQGDSYSNDSCQPCTAEGDCAVGYYYDVTQCLGNGFNDTTCQPCTAIGDCASGFYFEATNCQGDTSTDDSCAACTTSGSCPSRTYFDATKCQGDGTADDSCVSCTTLGNCVDNYYFDATFCVGSGTSDDQCQPCTTSGNCPVDHYYSASECDGSGFLDDSCVECTAAGACASGTYHNSSICAAGDGEIDSCLPCTTTGNCPDGYFFDTSSCDGSGSTDDACQVCSTLGNCPTGSYFDAAICANGESEVDSCVACSTTCAAGYFYDSSQCQGDGIVDDTCVLCDDVIPNCLLCSSGSMCDTCAPGYTVIDATWLGETLADGTVVTLANVYGQCLDVDPPDLTNCPPQVFIEADPVAQIYYAHWLSPESPLPLTALDAVDGSIELVCIPKESGDAVGTYTSPDDDFNVTCRATDNSSNIASCSFFVEIADATPPTFANCPSSIQVTAAYGSSTASASWTPPTASDDVDGALIVYGSDFPGDEFPVGNHTVTYYAVDLSGNAAYCRFFIVVELVGTTTPDPFESGFGGTPEPTNASSDYVEDAVADISISEGNVYQIQSDNDSDGLGAVVNSTRTATSKVFITFDSFCSDPDTPVVPDTSDLTVIGGIIEGMMINRLGLVADSVSLTERCAAVDIVTQLVLQFGGKSAGDGDYSALEDDIVAEIASTLGLSLADVTMTSSINQLKMVVEVTSGARISNDDLVTIISSINDNTDVNTFNLGPAASVVASEVTVFNDMATDITLSLVGTYDNVTDYSTLETIFRETIAAELDINDADVVVLTGISSAATLELRVITPGHSSQVYNRAMLALLDAASTGAGSGGVDSIDYTQLTATEVFVQFLGNQTDGADFSALETEIAAEVASGLGLDSEDVLVEEALVNSRIVLLVYTAGSLLSDAQYDILSAINTHTDVANTELFSAAGIRITELSATETDSRNQLMFTVRARDFVSEQFDLADLLQLINEEAVLSKYVNEDGQPVGSARSGYV